jgi:hypothetical protein
LGPLWYFQMQLFDCFHDFFHIMITRLPYLTVAPLTIQLHRYPIALVSHLSLHVVATYIWSYSAITNIPTLSSYRLPVYGLLGRSLQKSYSLWIQSCSLLDDNVAPRLLAQMNTAWFIAICQLGSQSLSIPLTMDCGWKLDLEMPIAFLSMFCI